MRQLLTLVLSFGALVLVANLPAQPVETGLNVYAAAASNKSVELAKLELPRMTDLVAAGALPRIRIQQAEANLADAKDEVILGARLVRRPSRPRAPAEEASAEMIAAAQRRVDRQQARLEDARKIVAAGVAARSYLAPFEAELTARQTGLESGPAAGASDGRDRGCQ